MPLLTFEEALGHVSEGQEVCETLPIIIKDI